MIEMRAICKSFRTDLVQTHALRELNLTINAGEFVSITGPSGSGKTTFLNVVGLLEEFDSGAYVLDGNDVSKLNDDKRSDIRNEKIGFIFQSFNLIPDLNVADNVDVPLRAAPKASVTPSPTKAPVNAPLSAPVSAPSQDSVDHMFRLFHRKGK